jgi:DHA1 family multidrug resistance protein-like MFS transporter
VGQIVYHLSKRKWFQYPEEIDGFVVPERYRLKSGVIVDGRGTGLETSRSSTLDTAVDAHGNEGGNGDKDGRGRGEMIVVDWYGPDDPENPQNWYVKSSLRNSVNRKYTGPSLSIMKDFKEMS